MGRCGCKGDRCPHIVLGQGREICEDFGCCCALREARQNRAQGSAELTLYDGLAAGDRWISVNPLLVVEGMISLASILRAADGRNQRACGLLQNRPTRRRPSDAGRVGLGESAHWVPVVASLLTASTTETET